MHNQLELGDNHSRLPFVDWEIDIQGPPRFDFSRSGNLKIIRMLDSLIWGTPGYVLSKLGLEFPVGVHIGYRISEGR